jgi:hypothetical protein
VVCGQWCFSAYDGDEVVFLSLSEIDSECFVDSGVDSQLALKGVGSVRFQLESGGFLEVAEVLFIPEMTINLLSVSALEIDGFGVAFYYGRVFLYLEGATPDTTILLGVRHERLYRLLGQLVIGSSGYLDSESVSVSESGQVAWERELISGTQFSSSTLRGLNRYELTQTDAQESVETPRSMSSVHRSVEVATEASSAVGAEASSSEGATTTTDGMMELETDSGGGTRSTSLAKREC